jgi:hypothetical protein
MPLFGLTSVYHIQHKVLIISLSPPISLKIRRCKARDLKPIKSPQFVLLAHLVIIATCADLSYKSKVPTQFQAI